MPHDGDLGQTFDSNRTLTHYESNPIKGQNVLFVGDLSYADKYPLHDKNRWDTWGRFGEGEPFKPYTHRYFVPYEASGSTSPLWYSIKRASAYIIVLSSYSAYVTTPTPLYSTYVHHYMEGETMRVMYEQFFVQYKVDVVFAGHVHAYERTDRVSNIAYNIENRLCTSKMDASAPVHITIGDGGNQEGLLYEYVIP
ncbi:putative Acid phosphatase [Helianthus annuus]|nr:putative Acid phosphatase [Helianthus annuus]